MIPPFNPYQQPAPAVPYAPPAPYGMPAPASPPSFGVPPAPPTPSPLARVLPLIEQANAILPHVSAGQLAILFVIAAVGKRTNNHPYFPAHDEQGDMQVLRQLQLVQSHGDGYTLTSRGDAVIVAERLNRLAVLA